MGFEIHWANVLLFEPSLPLNLLSTARVDFNLGVVGVLNRSLDPEHLPERVLVAVLHFEVLPSLPEVGGHPGVGHLSAVTIDGSGSIDLAKLGLHVSESVRNLKGTIC